MSFHNVSHRRIVSRKQSKTIIYTTIPSPSVAPSDIIYTIASHSSIRSYHTMPYLTANSCVGRPARAPSSLKKKAVTALVAYR